MPSAYVRHQATWYNWATIQTTSAAAVNYTWNTWNAATTTGGIYYNTDTTWNHWVTSTGTNTTYVNGQVWDNWATQPQIYSPEQYRRAHGFAAAPAYTQPRETEEERVAREAHWERIRAEQDAARIQRDIEQTAVRDKALDLLAMVLSKSQMDEYRRTRSFRVRGSHGRRYRVHHGTSGNVRQIVEQEGREQEVASLCAHPRMYDAEGVTGHGPGYLPTEDCLAAQALALMTNEEEFIRTANIHRGRLQPA